jgi:WD40 repeat protein
MARLQHGVIPCPPRYASSATRYVKRTQSLRMGASKRCCRLGFIAFVRFGLWAALANLYLTFGSHGFTLAADTDPANATPDQSTSNDLTSTPPDTPLPAGAVRLGAPRFRHDGLLHFTAFTPDGKLFVSQGDDDVRVWNAATFRELRRFGGKPGAQLLTAALSADGTLLAIADSSRGGTIQIREPTTGRLVREITDLELPLTWLKVCFSPDGKKLAGISATGPRIVLWDVSTGAALLKWTGAEKRIWDVVFTPDGKSLISGGDENVIRCWDTSTGKLQRQIGGELDEVGRLAISPDGRYLASISQRPDGPKFGFWKGDAFVRLWETTTGKLLHHLAVPAGSTHLDTIVTLNALTFTPDSKYLLTGDPDRTVRIWDLATATETRQIRDPAGITGLMALSPDSRLLVIGPLSREVFVEPTVDKNARRAHTTYVPRNVRSDWFQLFNFASGRELFRPTGHSGGVVLSAFSADGRFVATASAGQEILVWDATTGRELRRLIGHQGEVTALNWLDGGRKIVSVATDQSLRTWDTATGKEIRRVTSCGSVKVDWQIGPQSRAAISPDGRFVAVADQDGSAVVTDAATGAELHSLGVRPGKADCVFFTPDSRTLLIGSTESALHSWDLIDDVESPRSEIRESTAPFCQFYRRTDVRLSADGKMLAAAREDGALVTIDFTSQRMLHKFRRPNYGDTCCAISPDSSVLAWSGGRQDPGIVLLDPATGRAHYRLPEHACRCLSLTFSADGKKLASGSEDGTAMVWDLKASANGR